MENRFWIGEKRMEIFKLWLASKISLFRHGSIDYQSEIEYYKDILNSLGNSYLPEKADIQYGIFVNELLDMNYLLMSY
jgi:hypothetical protein